MKRLIVETHLVKSFVAQIVHKDICVSKKLLHELHAFFVLEIDRNEVLVGVVKVDRRIFHARNQSQDPEYAEHHRRAARP